MTERELRKLRRTDLLEMMLTLTKENEDLRRQLEKAQQQLADRLIAVNRMGSLAEAALQLNGVFEAAQAACEQYIQNVQYCSENTEQFCARMEQETQAKCDQMIEVAKMQADEYWQIVRERIRNLNNEVPDDTPCEQSIP